MSLSRIDSNSIAANAISTADLADSSITENKIANNAITSVKISGIIPLEKGGTGLSSVGLAGNVLTSNGTAFVSQELVIPAAPNGFASVQVFNTVGNVTYTKPADLVRIKVTVVGGGGGGRSYPGQAGGGAGGASIKFIPAPSIPGPVVATVGQGGIAGNPTATPGNTSSFGAFVSATGGTGSTSSVGGVGGIGSNGDINVVGGRGIRGVGPSGPGNNGGSSIFGGQGAFGAGGPYFGNGSNGIVVVEEFF